MCVPWTTGRRRVYVRCGRDGIAGDNGTKRRRARVMAETEPEPNQTGFDSYFQRARARVVSSLLSCATSSPRGHTQFSSASLLPPVSSPPNVYLQK